MVFMVASTNLVVELGIVLWLLIGWQFALAEFVGGAIMIVLLGLVLPRVIPQRWIDDGPRAAQLERQTITDDHGTRERRGTSRAARPAAAQPARVVRRCRLHDQRPDDGAPGTRDRLRRRRLPRRAGADGLLAVAVPHRARILVERWRTSCSDRSWRSSASSARSATCRSRRRSGRAASASAASVSFVFADLITLPLLLIYRRYFGGRDHAAAAGGLLGDHERRPGSRSSTCSGWFGIAEPARPAVIGSTGFAWNYTTVLNLVALVGFGRHLLAVPHAATRSCG